MSPRPSRSGSGTRQTRSPPSSGQPLRAATTAPRARRFLRPKTGALFSAPPTPARGRVGNHDENEQRGHGRLRRVPDLGSGGAALMKLVHRDLAAVAPAATWDFQQVEPRTGTRSRGGCSPRGTRSARSRRAWGSAPAGPAVAPGGPARRGARRRCVGDNRLMAARRSYGTGSLYVRTRQRTAARRGTASGATNGRQVKRRIGPKRAKGTRDGLTRTQAEARAAATHRARPSPRAPTGEALTIAEVAPPLPRATSNARAASGRRSSAVESILDVWLAAVLGDRALDAIRGEDVEDLMRMMEAGAGPAGARAARKPAAARRRSATTSARSSAIYGFAMHARRRWATRNPCDDVELPAVEATRTSGSSSRTRSTRSPTPRSPARTRRSTGRSTSPRR